jgi:hypothetical protein
MLWFSLGGKGGTVETIQYTETLKIELGNAKQASEASEQSIKGD